jgi:hypothetical protein
MIAGRQTFDKKKSMQRGRQRDLRERKGKQEGKKATDTVAD